MGTRSNNYIALKPGIDLDGNMEKFRSDMKITRLPAGTLILYETNFTPMYARAHKLACCTYDLLQEVAVQEFLGKLDAEDFYMKRAGDMCDYRGAWLDHPFTDHPEVASIEEDFSKESDELPASNGDLPENQRIAIQCAHADLVGAYQAMSQCDIHAHDWDAHRTSIEEMEEAFPFIEKVDLPDNC